MNKEIIFLEFEKYLKNENIKLKKECIKYYMSIIEEFFDFGREKYQLQKCKYNVTERKLLYYRKFLKDKGMPIIYINERLCIIEIYEKFLIYTERKQKSFIKPNIFYTKEKRTEQLFNEKAFKSFLKEKSPNIKKSTIDFYVKIVKEYIMFAKTKYKSKKKFAYYLSKRKIVLYKRWLKERGYKLETINTRIYVLKKYEEFLFFIGIKENTILNPSVYYKEKERKNIKNIGDESYEYMVEMAKKESSKYYLILILFVRFKIPTKRIVNIKIKDIYMKEEFLNIDKKKIQMSKELKIALKRYLRDRKKFLGKYKNEYLLVSHIGKKNGEKMEKTSVSMIIKKYFEKLKNSDYYYGYWSDLY